MNSFNSFIWSFIFLPGVIICGAVLTVGSSFLQFRCFPLAMKLTVGKAFQKSDGEGVSPLQAASTALASTVGTGNIVGTAQAICMGGPGAVFWLWVASLFGMIIKYAEIFLALKTRQPVKGTYLGGPMYYIKEALPTSLAPAASAYAAFAVFSALGMGNLSQINSSVSAVSDAAVIFSGMTAKAVPYFRLISGILLALLLSHIIKGGAKGIGRAAELLVPFMSAAFLITALIVIICHAQKLPRIISEIFTCALSPKAAAGACAGLSLKQAIHWGIRRSAFSNEAGLGSSALAHVQANTDSAFEHSMWGIFEVFADTVIICSAAAFCILLSGIDIPWGTSPGPELLKSAFATVFGAKLSSAFVGISMLLFGFATVMAWYYYGEQCLFYISGNKYRSVYRLIYLLCIPAGSVMSTSFIWTVADTANAMMAIPNLAALLILSGRICSEIRADTQKFIK